MLSFIFNIKMYMIILNFLIHKPEKFIIREQTVI